LEFSGRAGSPLPAANINDGALGERALPKPTIPFRLTLAHHFLTEYSHEKARRKFPDSARNTRQQGILSRYINSWAMKIPLFICLMVLAISCSTSMQPPKNSTDPALSSEEKLLWFWFAGDGPKMSLQVCLDEKIIYQTTFPICHAKRSSAHSNGQEKSLHFLFDAPRAMVWQGYKDADETTPPNQRILGDIWLAGAGPDCLILGITFRGQQSIYMNTLHIAYPNQRDESLIASGLVIITTPLEENKAKTSNKSIQ